MGRRSPHTYTQYSVPFIASASTTNISFAFREDPAFLFLDDVAVQDITTSSSVPVVNGGFDSGPVGSNTPLGWTYLNSFGATFSGVVATNNPHSSPNNYYDGAVQAYDGITQAIATTPGNKYSISFWLDDNSGETTFSRVSTNGNVTDTGGNGIDLLVYAGAIPTLPEPASLALLGVGLVGIGMLRRRK